MGDEYENWVLNNLGFILSFMAFMKRKKDTQQKGGEDGPMYC
jgi:hypothetical protein